MMSSLGLKLEWCTSQTVGTARMKTSSPCSLYKKETRDVSQSSLSGLLFISPASEIRTERDWDVMYTSKIDYLRAKRTGRLLQYDPTTEEVTVLARSLCFANGISVDKEEHFIIFTETYGLRVGKYHLTGAKKGTIEYIVDGAPSPGCRSHDLFLNLL